ncbi:DoxX family protein [Massilia sp. RP-1-19]|uniref:DoxX family protein n=1 Tax=Massilia polaris TaxID=2728846 RepID=A0A848HV77_9BURK|nr:DoxX family protein [Massilia polaris]NML62628.1 DoxX family protein [Massilia polaris]
MQTTVTTTSNDDLGKLVIRAAVALMVLLHGISKLTGGIDGITGMVTNAGLPAILAYGVYVGEVIAPILVLIGLWTRAAAVVMVINMVVAIVLAHMGDLAKMNDMGGWALELQGMFLFGAIAVALLGAGRYSIGGINGKWN